MPQGHPYAAIAFDVMDTLIRDPYREALEAATGLTPTEIFRRRSPHAYPRFERGEITETEYWRVYAEAGIVLDVDTFHAARRAGYRWLPGMRDLLRDLRGAVLRIGATNYPDWIEQVATDHLDGLLDVVHASVQLGARKPDPAFYARLLERCDLEAGRVLFVDDREPNVEGAREAGLATHLFTGAEDLRRRLRRDGLPV